MENKTIIGIVAAVIIVGGGWLLFSGGGQKEEMDPSDKTTGAAALKSDDSISSSRGSVADMSDKSSDRTDALTDMADASTEGAGTYEPYSEAKLANAENGDVVLFFRASWCPSCRALDGSIKENAANIPAGITILDTDYDTYSDLKKKYGITTQHTLVQVDANGNEIAKWVGSNTLDDVLAQVQ